MNMYAKKSPEMQALPLLTLSANTRNNLDSASLHLGHFLHSNEFKYTKRPTEMQAFHWVFPYFDSQITAYRFDSLEYLKHRLFKLFVSYVLVTDMI